MNVAAWTAAMITDWRARTSSPLFRRDFLAHRVIMQCGVRKPPDSESTQDRARAPQTTALPCLAPLASL